MQMVNFRVLEMQKRQRNIPTDTAKRIDEKKESFFYLSCLLPDLWSLKSQK